MIDDLTLFVYAIELIICAITFLLFLWYAIYMYWRTKHDTVWYCKQCSTTLEVNAVPNNCPSCHGNTGKFEERTARKKPSVIYIMIMLLFLFQGWSVLMGYYARSIRPQGIADTLPFFYSFWWDTRVVPRLIIEALISWRMILRVYLSFLARPQRRISDNDGRDV